MNHTLTQVRLAMRVGTAAAIVLACFLTTLIFLAHQRLSKSSRWSSARNLFVGLSFIVAWAAAILMGVFTMDWFGSQSVGSNETDGFMLVYPNVFIDPAPAWKFIPAAAIVLTWLALRFLVSARRRT